ncbi:TRXH1 [Auxenochlorella protothecoides x Auxenochlorella symbiontica]|uniref:Thioredoxin H-type n=1 Tax=Auxenochlorella protothecoides TaxID=3075 RepID=A0A087SFX4_AUXPR|nr:Thioredoxin H-type [Auxenochlorella protothecoides]KFM24628.1 Thioredoxin H-type [Auxenochlorella protothecoides]
MAGGKVVVVNSKAEWDQVLNEAKNSGKAVIVDFFATWCGPCRLISPYFQELSSNYDDVVFVKLDVDQVEEVAQALGITAMPTFQVFQSGEKVDELIGASKDKLKSLVEKYSKVGVAA